MRSKLICITTLCLNSYCFIVSTIRPLISSLHRGGLEFPIGKRQGKSIHTLNNFPFNKIICMNLKKYLPVCCALFIWLQHVDGVKAQSIYFSPPITLNSQYPCGVGMEVRAEQITEDQLGILWMIGKDSVTSDFIE